MADLAHGCRAPGGVGRRRAALRSSACQAVAGRLIACFELRQRLAERVRCSGRSAFGQGLHRFLRLRPASRRAFGRLLRRRRRSSAGVERAERFVGGRPPVARPRPRASCSAPSSARPEPSASRPAPVGGFRDPAAELPDAVAARARLRPTRSSSSSGPPFSLPASSAVAVLAQRLGPLRRPAPGRSPPAPPGARRSCAASGSAPSSRSASVIGPSSVAATTTKGDSKPGPTVRAMSSLSARAGLSSASCSGLGGPVFSAERRRRQDEDDGADRDRDRERAAQRGADERHQPRPLGRRRRRRSASGRRWGRAG